MNDKRCQRPSEVNQQVAKSVRPQLPRDGSKDGQNSMDRRPNNFIPVWDYGNGKQTKRSRTHVEGKKVF